MDNSTFFRKIDELGRIVIPIELRKFLDIKENDSLGISLNNNSILIKKAEPSCVFCNSNTDLKSFYGKDICKNCINNLK